MPTVGNYHIPTWICMVVPTFYLLYKFSTRGYDKFRKKGIPGPRPIPVLGNGPQLMSHGFVFYDQYLRRTFGKVVGTFQGTTPELNIFDLDIIKEIMIKNFSSFQNHNDPGFQGAYIVRKFLSILKFDHWRHVRNTVSPTFSGAKLRKMTESINRCCRNLMSHLKKKADNGEVFDAKSISANFTIDVIATTAFGVEIDSQSNPDNETAKHGRNIMDSFSGSFNLKLILFLISPKLMMALGIPIFPTASLEHFSNLVEQAMKMRTEDDQKSKDFLQLIVDIDQGDPTERDLNTDANLVKTDTGMVYSKKGLTREEILATSMLFFLAGHDTTADGLAFLLYNLACNADKQEILYQEIMEVMGEQEDPDYDIIKKMPYLHMCIEESLRLFPPAPRTDRMCNETVQLNGLEIEEGTIINISPMAIHHDPEIWPEPEKFIPERFTPEEKEARHPMAWMPFGQGPRNCIAMRLALMELKFAAIHVLKNFRLVTCEETQIPMQLPKMSMTPVGGIKMKAERR